MGEGDSQNVLITTFFIIEAPCNERGVNVSGQIFPVFAPPYFHFHCKNIARAFVNDEHFFFLSI